MSFILIVEKEKSACWTLSSLADPDKEIQGLLPPGKGNNSLFWRRRRRNDATNSSTSGYPKGYILGYTSYPYASAPTEEEEVEVLPEELEKYFFFSSTERAFFLVSQHLQIVHEGLDRLFLIDLAALAHL